MAEVAKLVEALFDNKKLLSLSSSDLSQKLRSDSSFKLGLQKLYFTLKQGVESIGDGKLGLQCWDQSQIQALASVALAIVCSTRSLSVEHVEPIIVAVVQKSLEFALCYLEKSIHNSDDLSVQLRHAFHTLSSGSHTPHPFPIALTTGMASICSFDASKGLFRRTVGQTCIPISK